MQLRNYQQACDKAIMGQFKQVRSTLACLPTGTGKTRIAAEVIHNFLPKRTMFVAHRRELLFQAWETLFNSRLIESDLEMGDLYADKRPVLSSVVLAMVQSLNSKDKDGIRRLRRFRPAEFGLLVIDEAHHGVCDSYKTVIEHFVQNQNIKILLLTATPDRMDEEALGQICDSVAFDYEILDAISDGWLVEPMQQFVAIEGLDFSSIKTTDGDFNGAELAEVMEMERNLQGVADATLKLAGNRRTLVFTASVKQAEMLSHIFNRHRPGCSEMVSGFTHEDKRKQLLKDYNEGRIQILCNCNCLSEGFDSPMVEVVVQASPTKSRALYAQRCGRALRPEPGLVDRYDDAKGRVQAIAASSKPCALVLDFVGNSGRHKLVSVADLLGGEVSDDAKERVTEEAKSSLAPVQMSKALVEAEKQIEREAREKRLWDAARKVCLVGTATFSMKSVSPFDVFDLAPVKMRGWDMGKMISNKERLFFLRQHIDPTGMSQSQRNQLRRDMFRRWKGKLATIKQCAIIKRHYPKQDTRMLTQQQASAMIDQLKMRHWKPIQETLPL